jgi:hypothetical protein
MGIGFFLYWLVFSVVFSVGGFGGFGDRGSPITLFLAGDGWACPIVSQGLISSQIASKDMEMAILSSSVQANGDDQTSKPSLYVGVSSSQGVP